MRRRLRPLHQEGLDSVFSNDNDIEEIIAIVTEFNLNADTKFGAFALRSRNPVSVIKKPGF